MPVNPDRPQQATLTAPPSSVDAWLEKYLRHVAAAEPPQREVVIVVHGTFANPGRTAQTPSRHCLWWEPRGSFSQKLDEALARHGSVARCRQSEGVLERLARDEAAILGEEKWPLQWSGWSGANSEVERRRGAYELAEHIRRLQRAPTVHRVHIVAHSHGGNIVRRSLRYSNDPRFKLGTIVCLGTPFLHFDDKAAWRRWAARVHWPMLAVVVSMVAALWFLPPRTTYSLTYGLSVVFLSVTVGALHSLWRFARTSEASSDDGEAIALQFARDEAIQWLRKCADVTVRPHLHLRRVLEGLAPTQPLECPPRASDLWDGWIGRALAEAWRLAINGYTAASNVWNGPACRIAERATSFAYRLPLAGGACALLLILAFRPYRPTLRPFFSSRMPRLASLFFHSIKEVTELIKSFRDLATWPPRSTSSWEDPWKTPPFSFLQRAAAALAAALTYVTLYPIDKLLGLPSWVGAVMTRFAILVGARAAAASAPGMDVLATAFRPARTGRWPEGVTRVKIPKTIQCDIEQRLSASSHVDFAALRSAFGPAQRASLLDAVNSVFSGVHLLHAQYYQDDRIIDAIAQCIAGKRPPEWEYDAAAFVGARDARNDRQDT